MKIVVNKCFGGFSLTEDVYKELGIEWDEYGYLRNEDLGISSDNYMAYRSDPNLINAIEKIGESNSGGWASELEIVDIPDGIEYTIDDYDGFETVHEVHRSW